MTYESHPPLNGEEQNKLNEAITEGEKALLREGYDDDFKEVVSNIPALETQLQNAIKERDLAIARIEELEELLKIFHNRADPVFTDDDL